jgi:hypothetical protein
VLENTRKPFKMWFRAIFEISTRRTGISAKDLQRIMGFGSYETAWTWLHKLRAAMVRSDSEPFGPFVEMDEALVGGKGGPHKQLVLVAAEANGRVRLAHAENNDEGTCRRFADGEIAAHAHVVTDGHAGYNETSLGPRPHEAVVQTKAQRRQSDAVQALPPQPPQDQRRRAHRSPHHRKSRCQTAPHHAPTRRRHASLPPLQLRSNRTRLN